AHAPDRADQAASLASGTSGAGESSGLSFVDADELVEHRERLLAVALEGIAADDRAVAATVADGAGIVIARTLALLGTPGEDDDPPAVEGGLHAVADAGGRARDVDLVLLVDLLGLGLFEMVGRELDLDDMCAEKGGHLGGIGGDVDRGLAILGEVFTARIGPDDGGEPLGGRLLAHGRDLLEHVEAGGGARIDGEADGGAAEAKRVIDARGDRLVL